MAHTHVTAATQFVERTESASLTVACTGAVHKDTQITRSSSKSCVTSTLPPSRTASASSTTFASATTWCVRTTRWAWRPPPAALAAKFSWPIDGIRCSQ